jgi:hypothetical protein
MQMSLYFYHAFLQPEFEVQVDYKRKHENICSVIYFLFGTPERNEEKKGNYIHEKNRG